MSDIMKKYVDYAGLQEYDSQIKSVISTDFVGATSSDDGAAGRVPAPESGDENKYLRGDGTWSSVNGSAHTIKNGAGTSLTQRQNLQFVGLNVADNSTDNVTVVSPGLGDSYNIVPHVLKTQTKKGVTITNNGDGSYTLSGTATALVTFTLWEQTHNFLGNNNWLMSIGPSLTTGVKFHIHWKNSQNNASAGDYVGDDEPLSKTISGDYSLYDLIDFSLSISSGTSLSDLTIYPSVVPSGSNLAFRGGALNDESLTYEVDMIKREGATIYANSFNMIPYHAVKTQTVSGVTITNNKDGTFTLNGTATQNIGIDLLTGYVEESLTGLGVTKGFLNFLKPYGSDKQWRLALWSDSAIPMGLSLIVWFVADNVADSEAWYIDGSGSQGFIYSSPPAYPYIDIQMAIDDGTVLNNLIVKPTLTPSPSRTDFVQGAMSNIMITDYLLNKTLSTFKGTSQEWTSLSDEEKRSFKLVILDE